MLNPLFGAILRANGIATASDKGIVPESLADREVVRKTESALPVGEPLTRAEHIACAQDRVKGRS